MKNLISKIKNNIGLLIVTVIASVLNIYNIWLLGVGNTYYAAAIKSMLSSFSNFFFVSFDTSGFISVDKAPLSLWVDALSAKIFGFSGISILLPHAIEGVIVTILMFKIVQKIGGKIPAFIAALAITLSPVNVAVYRNNTPDALLLVFVMFTVWFALQFFDKQKLKYLLLSACMLGLGFNTKMLQAYLILPAVGSAIFLFSPGNIWQRIRYSLIFLVVCSVISFSWITIVDLTPASMRPFVGGSTNNSAWNLALGYNGAQRLLGENSVGGNSGFNVGNKGLFRLFQGEMGTQAGWLLPSVIAYSVYFLITKVKKLFRKVRGMAEKISLHEVFTFISILFFATAYMFFSYASFFHSYYLNIFAISIAFLIGSLIYELSISEFKNKILLGMLGLCIPIQVYLISQADYAVWLIPTILLTGLLGIIILFFQKHNIIQLCGAVLLSIGIFLTPFIWSGYTTIEAKTATAIFIGGPSVAGSNMGMGDGRGGPPMSSTTSGVPPTGSFDGGFRQDGGNGFNQQSGGMFGSQTINSTLLNYLKEQYSGEKYFLAVSSQQQATGFMLDQNIGNIMTLGGFSGRDAVLTLSQFKEKIASGELRFFLNQGNGMARDGGDGNTDGQGGGMFNANTEITTWVTTNCTAVSGITGLYDCKV